MSSLNLTVINDEIVDMYDNNLKMVLYMTKLDFCESDMSFHFL